MLIKKIITINDWMYKNVQKKRKSIFDYKLKYYMSSKIVKIIWIVIIRIVTFWIVIIYIHSKCWINSNKKDKKTQFSNFTEYMISNSFYRKVNF